MNDCILASCNVTWAWIFYFLPWNHTYHTFPKQLAPESIQYDPVTNRASGFRAKGCLLVNIHSQFAIENDEIVDFPIDSMVILTIVFFVNVYQRVMTSTNCHFATAGTGDWAFIPVHSFRMFAWFWWLSANSCWLHQNKSWKLLYPLVMTNSSPWYRWPIEIDGLPNLIAWWIFPWQTVSHNQRVLILHSMTWPGDPCDPYPSLLKFRSGKAIEIWAIHRPCEVCREVKGKDEKRPCHQAYQVRKTWHSTFLPEFSIYSTIFLDFFRKKDGEIKKIEYYTFPFPILSDLTKNQNRSDCHDPQQPGTCFSVAKNHGFPQFRQR